MKSSTIFVDLDGTLIQTDIFLESMLEFIKVNPLNLFYIIVWLFRGRSYAKAMLADKIEIDVSTLPYHQQLIVFLKQEKQDGKRLILATATHMKYASAISAHLGLFDDVIATTEKLNLKGANKLNIIQEIMGEEPFAYAGDSSADHVIWESCSDIIAVNRTVTTADFPAQNIRLFPRQIKLLKVFIKEMRVHQWTKNVLIFVPLLTSHLYTNMDTLVMALIGFVSFSLCASGVYFFNDLLDLNADRQHKSKKTRPLASGNLPITLGIIGAVGLPALAFLIAIILLPTAFILLLLGYFILTNAYSLKLKRMSTIDVMTLAALYTSRIVAGAAVTGITLSTWLMAFSIFTFVSLAFLKRYIEISDLPEDSTITGRGYGAADKEAVFSLGIANITAAVVIFALYIDSDEVKNNYNSPELLWLLCFLLLFWGNRIWLGARRNKINEDPIIFAVKDKISRLTGIFFVLVLLLARYY